MLMKILVHVCLCVLVCVCVRVCLKNDKLFLRVSANTELKLVRTILKNKIGKFVPQISRCIVTLQQLRKHVLGAPE